MIVRIFTLAIVGVLLFACDKSDRQEATQRENSSPTVEESLYVGPQPEGLNTKTGVATNKTRQIDTTITPEMIKGIRFQAGNDNDDDVYSDKPFNLDPAGMTRISVTPKLFFKEELDLTQNYMDNIDGAFVQIEMKFD